MDNQAFAYKNVPLFEGVSPGELAELLSCLKGSERTYKNDEVIIFDQENVRYIGVVLSGMVHMLKDDIYGNQTLLAYIGEGELIGEQFAVQKKSKSYVTFTAASDARLLFLPAVNIICSCPRQCAFHARLTQNMFDLMGAKSVRLMEKIEVSSKSSLREKILAYLSLLAQKQGGRYVTVPLNRTELAEYLDANRSAMTREMSAMRSEGLIDFDGNTFVIKKNI